MRTTFLIFSASIGVSLLAACSSTSSGSDEGAAGMSASAGSGGGGGATAGGGGAAGAGVGGAAGTGGGAGGASGGSPAECNLPAALASCLIGNGCQEAELQPQADALKSGCTGTDATFSMGPCPRDHDPPFAGYCVGGPTKGALQSFYYGAPGTADVLRPQCEGGMGVWCGN